MSTPILPKDNVFDSDSSRPKTPKVDCAKEASKCIAPIDMITQASGMYGYMMIYAYGVFKFQEVKELSG